ncbi:hypothetical protein pb186bvf_018589 [Paramecium bursaria]
MNGNIQRILINLQYDDIQQIGTSASLMIYLNSLLKQQKI